jgi:hypothetical protein
MRVGGIGIEGELQSLVGITIRQIGGMEGVVFPFG